MDSSKPFEIWRLLSSVFLHGDLGHLVYNLFALLFFGIILEKYIGSNKFLILFLASGIISNLVAINFYNLSLGASGAIFGIIGGLMIIKPNVSVFAFGMPMPMFLAGIFWTIGDIFGAYAFLSGNPMNNTGNISHLSGILFGILFGYFNRIKENKKEEKEEIDEEEMQRWENFYMNE